MKRLKYIFKIYYILNHVIFDFFILKIRRQTCGDEGVIVKLGTTQFTTTCFVQVMTRQTSPNISMRCECVHTKKKSDSRK
jgi:hypothetical protein